MVQSKTINIDTKSDSFDVNGLKTGTINLDKVITKARSIFKNSDKGLGLQLNTGASLASSKDFADYVAWPGSPFHLLTDIVGLPFGKIIQISGRPDSGKSTHAMQFMKLAQDQGCIVVLWDSEGKFGTNRFDHKFDGCSADLAVCTSRMISEGADEVESLVHAIMEAYPDKKVLIVWDSIGGSLPKSEKGKSKRDSKQMAEAAKENGAVVRGFVMLMEEYRNRQTNKDRIGILLINQVYSNIGAPGQVESGGQKVAFHSSLILQMTRTGNLFKVRAGIKRKIGIKTKVRVKKNHLFDGDDTIAEMILNISAGGITVNSSDPAYKLVPENLQDKNTEDLIDVNDDDPWEGNDE